MGILGKYHVVGLVHTGIDGEDTVLPGFTCIRALQRPMDPASGGLALFVKTHIKQDVVVVREHSELGMLWVKVHQTYICLLYIPHQNSSYYKRSDNVNRQKHWDTLNMDTAEFMESGQVMILGDFNSRTGCALEYDTQETDDWAEMESHMGVAPPCASIRMRTLCEHLPMRRSMDTTKNLMGSELLQVCKSHGLVILNGRLPGDENGTWTFYGPGRSCSVIDYIIVSPSLAFTEQGRVLRGCRMHMAINPHMLPARPGINDGRFDHMPVGAHIRWKRAPRQQVEGAHEPQPTNTRWVWRDELREDYITALERDDVQQLWQSIHDGMPADQAVGVFMEGLSTAVGIVHTKHGRVLQPTVGKNKHGRTTNGWYDSGCKQARSDYLLAVQQYGHQSARAAAAKRAYRTCVWSARKAHEANSRQELVRSMYADPKQFWRSYKGRQATSCGNSAQWTTHFRQLFAANTAGEYAGGSLGAHCERYRALFPEPSTNAREQAARLNVPFSESEVQRALSKLACDKAAGVDGIPAEFLQQACIRVDGQAGGQTRREFTLGPVITRVFNIVLKGAYPETWQVSALVPVPKPKGRPDVFDDHRGIAVSAVLSKLFSITMMARLDKWAEQQGLRADGQAGFRAGRGTPDNCFVLRHMIDAAAVKKKPLYCAFIDFSKAYDRVDRNLMWEVLRGCGLHGHMLNTIMNMYAVTKLQVRAQGQLGTPFGADVGVKQGCPISPLFFGLLIDRLEAHLERECPDARAEFAARVLRALLYADDVVLTADTPAALQSMLAALERFCLANSMFVNTGKSAVVVFNRRWHSSAMPGELLFLYNGAPLPIDPSYIYLGLKFEDGQAAKTALPGAVAKARKAMMAMFGRCYKMSMHNVDVQGRLFDTIVKPVLCYGCEIWGVDWVSQQCKSFDFASGVAEVGIHKPFMRQSLGVCSSTPAAAMYTELNRQPMSIFWLRMAAKLWNRALSRADGDVLKSAMLDNVRLATQADMSSTDRKRLWSHHFIICMQRLGLTWADEQGAPRMIDVNNLGTQMMARWTEKEWKKVQQVTDEAAWFMDPVAVRSAPSTFTDGFKLFTYQSWFQPDEWVRKESWMLSLHAPERIRVMAQFRLGSHWLAVQQGRFARTPRHQRCCAHCPGQREDELHLLECPRYAELRNRYNICTWHERMTDMHINEQFNMQDARDWNRLAEFLVRCKQLKNQDIQ